MAPAGGVTPYEVRQRRKDKVLTTLGKLDDRDTQAAAVTEIADLVRALDAEGLGVLVTCVCNIGDKQKVYSRKECVRLLGHLASERCPVAREAVQQPYVGKIIAAVRSRFKDQDSTVRDAASDALGCIAGGLAIHSERTLDHEHPLVKGLIDSLKESNHKEVQTAAADALRKAVPHLEVTAPLVRTIVKLLGSKTFVASGALLAALAGMQDIEAPDQNDKPVLLVEEEKIVGMVKYVPELMITHVPAIVGSPAGGGLPATGIALHLQSKEWTTRRSACEAVYALAAVLGPKMDGAVCAPLPASDAERTSARALQLLSPMKFDRVELVRRRAIAAIAVLTELQEFLDANLPYDTWSWSNSPLAGDGVHNGKETRKPGGLQSGTIKERFMKKSAAGDGDGDGDVDIIVKAQVVQPRSRPQTAPPRRTPPESPSKGTQAGPDQAGSASRASAVSQSVDGPLPKAASRSPGKAAAQAGARPQTARPAASEPFVPDLIIKAKPRPEKPPAPAPPAEPERAPGQWATTRDAGPPPSQAAAPVASNPPAAKQSTEGGQPTSPQQRMQGGMVAVPAAEWAGVLQRLAQLEGSQSRIQTMEDQQSRMLGMVENFALNTQNAFVAVEARVTALEMVVDDLARANTSVESSGAPDAQDPSEFFNATFAPDLPPGSAQSGEVQEATELGAQYAAAMKGFRGGERGSLEELLRRTGPQWKHMSEGTALQVLEAMEQLVKEDPITTLPGVLPWLWQLADEDIVRLPVPSGLAASVVVALKEVPEDCAALVGGNLPLLVSTLEWLWSLSAPSPSPPPASTRPHHRSAIHAHAPATPPSGLPPVSPLSVHAAQQRAAAPDASTPRGSHRRRASKDGIHAMQAQLNAMQAELVNSPRVRG
eukprot:jgi/Tetstr1/448692/TSEL_035932.t1